MTEEHMFTILNKIFSRNELTELAKKLVVQGQDNSYVLYDEYSIIRFNNKFIVRKFGTDLEKSFYSTRNAVIWTTLYKRSNLADALKVETLDKILEGILFNMDLYHDLSKKTKDLDKKLMYKVKLEECKVKKKQINTELDGYVKNTRAWQEKLFKEAIK